jgi:hypothetical protein
MASDWNRFTSKIFKEGRAKHGKSYSFKQALKEASDRKGEMGKMGTTDVSTKSRKSMRKSKKSRGKARKSTRKNYKK